MHLSFHPSCNSSVNAQVWRTYLDMESRHRAGGFDLFEAVASKMNMSIESVVEIVYHCGDCTQRRQCQAVATPQAAA